MKISAKPISSPGRPDKYPPPLMRFLRSNVGSRSRGRSRSSPMFVRKKNTGIETQEPTSPKVTCMGQVRVKRSKNPTAPTKRRCKWIRNALFCTRKLNPNSFTPNWDKWVSFFRGSFGRKSKIRQHSSNAEPKFGEEESHGEDEDEDDEDPVGKVLVPSFPTPPRNALLLTRCRSAPYRSSSLAGRFWGSPLESEGDKERTERDSREEEDKSNPNPNLNPISKSSESENEAESENGSSRKSPKLEEILEPIILTRCKSEPARSGEKLDPELSLWRKRRLGFT
ncbi:uncharacterized protein LOC110807366 [Carica papaya]|uniref:uncharacterized protein LOC110807366 n=1 Tax=Carica papaya TaxID=3649 RepID=UPI000B8D0ACF|nr:uncharacterized protein LOC110807366 [Carica papaya]